MKNLHHFFFEEEPCVSDKVWFYGGLSFFLAAVITVWVVTL